MLIKPRTLVLILALILSVAWAYGCTFYGTSGGYTGTSSIAANMNAALDDTVAGKIVANDGDLKPEFSGSGSFSDSYNKRSGNKYAEVGVKISYVFSSLALPLTFGECPVHSVHMLPVSS
jgi:hypothetical protein